jgi:glyoxylase-like metal-dependent hydrolase (beta-lactamase superfamily II)
VLFDKTLVIEGDDLTLELFATPGHTVDHLSVYIPQCRTLLAADAAEFPFPMARTAEGLPALRRSLSRLAALEAQTILYCHAPVDMGPPLIEENIAYFDRLEQACRRALADGVPHDLPPTADVTRRVGLSYADAVPDTDVWQNVHDLYRTGGHAQQLRHMLAILGND